MPTQEQRTVLSLEAINSLIPELTELVSKQLKLRHDIEGRLSSLASTLGEVPESIVISPNDPAELRDQKRDLAVRIEEYRAGWKQVETMGGVVKDARTGLVDFYGQVDGKTVWLCWKYGESQVTHYHALDEGYTARKELRTSMKIRSLN